jgi:glucokinase
VDDLAPGNPGALGLTRLALVNDFAAQAMAIQLLEPQDLVTIGGPRGSLRTRLRAPTR